ncbi:hypothetical protein LC593_21645 [Nostoc sp. CHAB 5844]|nr:hypothetical protein [Nostoc sp. CHAB 5844]
MGRQCRGVSVAIFDVGASAVRWAALPTVTQLPRMVSHASPHNGGSPRKRLARLEATVVGFADSHASGVANIKKTI